MRNQLELDMEIKYCATLKLEKEKHLQSGEYYGKCFNDIKHYLNADMDEVETVAFPHTQIEKKTVWSPPRKWNPEILKDYLIKEVMEVMEVVI